jgi:multidrug resistance protein, MATE family
MGLKKALTNSNLRSLVMESWMLSWPMTVIMFLVFIIGLCDVYVAGRFGKEIQAAYGIAFQVYFLFSILASALTVGTVSVTARLFTSGRKNETHEAIDSSLIMTGVGSIVCGIAAYALGSSIIRLFSVPDSLKESAILLMRIYSIGLPFNYLLLNTNGIMRACGLIKRSLWTMLIVCVLNLVLNIALALHSPLGFRGIAVATVVSTGIGMAANMIFLRALISGGVRFSAGIARKIIAVGWPAGILQILWNGGTMVLFFIVSKLPRQNIEIMAALTNGLRIEAAIFLPAFAFNMSNAVIVGNLLGKKRLDDAFSAGIVTALLGVGVVTVMTLLVLLNARAISSFLSYNTDVINQCVLYIFISLIFEPIMAWGVILGGGLNGAGDTRSPMIIIALSVWLVRLPLAYALGIGLGWGAQAVWWAMNASILVQAALLTRRFFSKRWLRPSELAGF